MVVNGQPLLRFNFQDLWENKIAMCCMVEPHPRYFLQIRGSEAMMFHVVDAKSMFHGEIPKKKTANSPNGWEWLPLVLTADAGGFHNERPQKKWLRVQVARLVGENVVMIWGLKIGQKKDHCRWW